MAAPSATRAGYTPVEPPAVSVAADGRLAAVHEATRVTMLELPSAEPFAEVGVDPDAVGSEVGWIGTPGRLLVLSRYEAHSTVHLLDPHGPRSIAEIRLEAPMRLFASVGGCALVVGALGAAVIAATETHLTLYPFPTRTVPVTAGAAGTQFVVALQGSVEEWDPRTRLPTRRLRLPRAAAITAVGGSERLIWMTTQQEPARIDVIPLMNRGQPRAHDLPEPIGRIASHPRSEMLAVIGAETGRLYAIDLDGRIPTRILGLDGPDGIDRVEAAAVLGGRAGMAVIAQTGRPVVLVALDRREVEPVVAAAPGVPTISVAMAREPAGEGEPERHAAEPERRMFASERRAAEPARTARPSLDLRAASGARSADASDAGLVDESAELDDAGAGALDARDEHDAQGASSLYDAPAEDDASVDDVGSLGDREAASDDSSSDAASSGDSSPGGSSSDDSHHASAALETSPESPDLSAKGRHAFPDHGEAQPGSTDESSDHTAGSQVSTHGSRVSTHGVRVREGASHGSDAAPESMLGTADAALGSSGEALDASGEALGSSGEALNVSGEAPELASPPVERSGPTAGLRALRERAAPVATPAGAARAAGDAAVVKSPPSISLGRGAATAPGPRAALPAMRSSPPRSTSTTPATRPAPFVPRPVPRAPAGDPRTSDPATNDPRAARPASSASERFSSWRDQVRQGQPRGAAPAGAVPPGATPPGAGSPGALPAGAIPPGSPGALPVGPPRAAAGLPGRPAAAPRTLTLGSSPGTAGGVTFSLGPDPADAGLADPGAPSGSEDAARSWRDEVVAWSRAVLAGHAPQPVGAPVIDALIARLDLAPSLSPVLALLYGAHLCGERGVAPVEVSRLLARSWDEALGRGELAQHALASFSGSRVALAPVVQRMLDELPPLSGALLGEPGQVALLGPCVAVAGDEPLGAVAARCVAAVGSAILVAHDTTDRAALAFEARIYGAVAMRRIADAESATHELTIFVVPDEALAEQLGLPRLV